MAGLKFVEAIYAVKGEQEAVPGTYGAPTKIACLEKGDLPPQPEYKYQTCKPMVDDEYDFVKDPDTASIKIPLNLKLPMKDDLGIIEDLLISCGLAKTAAGGVVSFKPQRSWTDRMSMDLVSPRATTKVKGIAGTFTITMKPDEMVDIKFEMQGGLAGRPVELAPADADNTIEENNFTPDKMLWCAPKGELLINGTSAWVEEVVLKLGVTIADKPTFNGVVVIPNKKSTIDVKIRNTEQNETSLAAIASAIESNLVIPAYDQAGDVKFKVLVPKAAASKDNAANDEGFLVTTRTFGCKKTVKDDNFELQFL